MLSFRFDLTSGQVRVLMQVYSGGWAPKVCMGHSSNAERTGLDSESHFVPIVSRLIEKKLVIHVGEHGSQMSYGYHCTERGKMICRLIVEDAQRIINASALATKRKVS